jgi:hypothetical protein
MARTVRSLTIVTLVAGSCLGIGGSSRLVEDAASEVGTSLCRVSECPPCVVHLRVHFSDGSFITGSGVILSGDRLLTAAHVVAPKVQGGSLTWYEDGRWQLSAATLELPTRVDVVVPARSRMEEVITIDLREQAVKMSDPTLKHFEFTDRSKSFLLSEGRSWKTLPRGGDLALIRLPRVPKGVKPARIAAKAPEVGDWLTSVGLEAPDAIRVHVAKLKGFEDTMKPEPGQSPFVYFEVQAQKGDSGGPVFNSKGELVGINSAIGSRVEYQSNVTTLGNYTQFSWSTTERPCSFLASHQAIVDFVR